MGPEPACAKACPTNAIQFGEVGELQARAQKRVENLHSPGVKDAYLYRVPDAPGATGGIEPLNAFSLSLDKAWVYTLPEAPTLPQSRKPRGSMTGMLKMAALGWAAAAIPCVRDTCFAAVTDEVDVEAIVAVGRDKLTEDLLSFFTGRVFGDPAEAFRHAKDVRIDRKRVCH